MQTWLPTDVPTLPGRGRELRLYDTATAEVRPTTPGAVARMYVCGITPYDATHLGHAATYLTFDLVHRLWLDAGHQVHYVQNVTDIDDPLLERASRDGEDWIVLGMRETALFREDMEALRVLPPRHLVGAVESIPQIAEAVEKLLVSGNAYRIDDGTGDIYFDLATAERFGYESQYDLETMRSLAAARGGDPDRPGKRHELDPLLWRSERPGEPAWDSALGRGRPGWHVECSTIALDLLGASFDVQGGGSDLIFPHHEMSAAHAEALTGQWPFARHYVHTGMIGLNGAKMSKSQGNLEFVSRLRASGADRLDPSAIRLALFSGHYRRDREWTTEQRSAAEQRLARWRAAVAAPAGPDGLAVLDRLRERLTDDLDTPNALNVVDHWATQALRVGGPDRSAPELVTDAVDALLGIRL